MGGIQPWSPTWRNRSRESRAPHHVHMADSGPSALARVILSDPMASRALGAVFALLAALAFMTAFAGGAAPTVVPGWWDGHPRIEGRVFERKDLHIGLVTAYGCNRGETIKCQPLITETARVSVGYIELGVLALAALTAFALMRSTRAISDRRKLLGKALLIQAGVAALGGVVVLALGPQIRVAQRFEVPIGVGVAALWTGVASALVAAVIAIRLTPEQLRLRTSQAHKRPPEPKPAPAPHPFNTIPGPSPKSDPPPLPRLTPSRPPPIPASAFAREPAATASPPANASEVASPPDSVPASDAPLPPPGESASANATSFGRGTIPPPLSAISFWSQPPLAPVPPGVPAGPSAIVPPIPSAGVAPPLPTAPAVESAAPAAPPPLPVGPPAIPPSRPSAPAVPRAMAPSPPTIIHAIPPPPSAIVEPSPIPADDAIAPPTSDDDTASAAPNSSDGSPNASGDGPITATLVAVTPAPPPSDAVETNAEPVADPTSPQVEVPISTAPASLPPPKKAALTNSDQSPACPQCEAGMAWVDEHLRFYCGECRMYF